MSFALWTLLSIVVYILGAALFLWVTPRVYLYAYDQLPFTGYAALEIVAALCMFGAVAITYGLYSGGFSIKVLDFFFLLGILILTIRLSYWSFRRYYSGAIALSRTITGVYFLLLILAALYYIAVLFGL